MDKFNAAQMLDATADEIERRGWATKLIDLDGNVCLVGGAAYALGYDVSLFIANHCHYKLYDAVEAHPGGKYFKKYLFDKGLVNTPTKDLDENYRIFMWNDRQGQDAETVVKTLREAAKEWWTEQ